MICGEKRFRFDPGSPAFFKVEYFATTWKIIYDASLATASAIGIWELPYTVFSVNYADFVTSLTGIYRFNIQTPTADQVTLSLPVWNDPEIHIDLLSDTSKSIQLPDVTVSPEIAGWVVVW